MNEPEVGVDDVERFLVARYPSVDQIASLEGGLWSTAFSFRSAGRAFVVRFGPYLEAYEKDLMAAPWSRPSLPVPAVIDIGETTEGAFIVSERCEGLTLDQLPPDRLARAIDHLLEGLVALQEVDLPGTGYGSWRAPSGNGSHESWRKFLLSMADREDVYLRGWRERLAAEPWAQDLFDRGQRSLATLADGVPEMRRVVHSDLLAGNVLVSSDDRVSGVFDWANALAGDPLYDLAWLMFWAPWHPGIDPATIRDTARDRFGGPDTDARLLCYQLHVALDGIQFQAFAGRTVDLATTAEHTERLLAGL
jgi:hygromycin-B 4-O-kinase